MYVEFVVFSCFATSLIPWVQFSSDPTHNPTSPNLNSARIEDLHSSLAWAVSYRPDPHSKMAANETLRKYDVTWPQPLILPLDEVNPSPTVPTNP